MLQMAYSSPSLLECRHGCRYSASPASWRRLLIPHRNGIVIDPAAISGVNRLIFQQVTIGTRDDARLPVIARHVDIGAGAKILGPIKIGARARSGANAVVLSDIAERAVAVGQTK